MESYFLYSYSGEGISDFTTDIINKLQHIVYIDYFDQRFFHLFLQHIETYNFKAEIILDAVDPADIAGIILPTYKAGFFRNQILVEIEENETTQKFKPIVAKELAVIIKQVKKKETEILDKFSEAQHYYQDVKTLYESAISEDAYRHIVNELKSILSKRVPSQSKNSYQILPIVDHLFISALTYHGPVNLVHKFMSKVKQKIILKGDIGQIKSKMLYELSGFYQKLGHRVIHCHCPFEPSELDMIVIPDLDVMIIDGEKPHEIELSHPRDKQIDLMVECLNQFKLLMEIRHIKEGMAKYKQSMRQATLSLQDLRRIRQHFAYIANEHEYSVNSEGENKIDFNILLDHLVDDISS